MTNLQYEIRVPQKIYRRATIHYWAWYDFLRNRRYVSFEDLHKLFFKSDNVRFAFAQPVRNVCASFEKKKQKL